ncbi:MAG: lipoyl-dependent peroxiredoxin [Candidatus Eremiobacteraeota bacterium]|nr:lipoyl-dependent peroxiredoxin [Candidatus Eremiobacteraeota bacterium]
MNVPDEIARTATVRWEGDIARGRGHIDTESGKVSADYSFGTRFSGDPGTNPEELLAASHAACFSMALSLALTRAGHPPRTIDTTARVHLARAGEGFEIPRIELRTRVSAPGIDPGAFEELAQGAKAGCPISKALAAVPITLDAKLDP